jgi:hypothetical protein
MDVMPGASQLGAVKTPDRTAANDRDLHEGNGSLGVSEEWSDAETDGVA